MKWFQDRRAAAAARDQARAFFAQYEEVKNALFGALIDRAKETLGYDRERCGPIAALASNLMTGEPHPPEKLATIPESDREAAAALAEAALDDPRLVAAAASSAWLLANTWLVNEFDSKKNALSPKAAERIRVLANRATELAPTESMFFATLAQVLITTQDWDAAYSAATRAVELDANNPESLRLLANASIGFGKYDEAAALLDRAQAIHPSLEGIEEARTVIRNARR